jgi:transposase
MELYGAIDLHSNQSVVGIVDAKGEPVWKRKLPNDLEKIKAGLSRFAENLQGVVVESTAAQQYSGLKHTDDESDTFWLADQLRLGVLKEGYVYPREQRAVRDLLRKRGHLVQQRTRNILSIQNLTSRNRGVRLSSNQTKQLTVEAVQETYGTEEDLALAVTSTIRIVEALDVQLKFLEKRVKGKVKLSQPYQLLQTVSGIGEILAMTIMLEAGDMGRFPTVGNFASYCRCVDSRWLTNDKKKGSGNVKNGNRYLSWAFIEAANFAIQHDPVIARYYQRKAARSKPVVARKAIAHKLARACYYVLRDQVPFEVNKCFGH